MDMNHVVDKSLVERLFQVHADHLQEYFTGPNREIIKIGDTRAFVSAGSERTIFKKRMILAGDESPEVIDEIVATYDAYDVPCMAEINPANFYSKKLKKGALTNYLLLKGFVPEEFRSVWYCETASSQLDLPENITIESFHHDMQGAFLQDLAKVQIEAVEEGLGDEIKRSESNEKWIHYIAYVDRIPSATSTLFFSRNIGYLAWTFTRPEFRKQGLHGYLIKQRIRDAFTNGCDIAFSATSFNIQSARNLQTHGFRLAYNYTMFERFLGR